MSSKSLKREITLLNAPEQEPEIAERLERRSAVLPSSLIATVAAIFERVRAGGDRAVLAVTRECDGVKPSALGVPEEAIARAVASLTPELRAAIEVARSRIERVNRELVLRDRSIELEEGARVGELIRPLDSVALWVPCRKGPLLSTALMLVTAARVAGVRRIAVMMPPRADGSADPGTLAAAALAGATELFIGNGVALIAAASYGSDSVRTVDGVLGPGPGAIAAAMGMAGMLGRKTVVGIGPTDCAVLADETANPRLVAWDLASEAEHGPDSAALLVTPSSTLADAVRVELARILADAPEPRRRNLRQVFGAEGRGMLVVCPSFAEANALAARFAPEHLSIVCRASLRDEALASAVAGEILIGEPTPFAAANYAIGITAVLPTNGAARAISGITARDMQRAMTFAELDRPALERLGPTVEALAGYESLPCHAAAVNARFVP